MLVGSGRCAKLIPWVCVAGSKRPAGSTSDYFLYRVNVFIVFPSGPMTWTMCRLAAAYESTPRMRARDVYLEIGDAAWQGAPLGAVAAGLGLTLAEMLRRYLRARRVYERTAG
jgi:hypothetical protein